MQPVVTVSLETDDPLLTSFFASFLSLLESEIGRGVPAAVTAQLVFRDIRKRDDAPDPRSVIIGLLTEPVERGLYRADRYEALVPWPSSFPALVAIGRKVIALSLSSEDSI